MPLRTGASTTNAGRNCTGAGGCPVSWPSGLVAQQGLFKSSTAAKTHGRFEIKGSQFTPKRTSCSGEDLWEILRTNTALSEHRAPTKPPVNSAQICLEVEKTGSAQMQRLTRRINRCRIGCGQSFWNHECVIEIQTNPGREPRSTTRQRCTANMILFTIHLALNQPTINAINRLKILSQG